MKRMLWVVDPIDGSTSVQFELLRSLSRGLTSHYSLVLYTPHCGAQRERDLRALGFDVRVGSRGAFVANRWLDRFGKSNESMLWAESWLREALLHRNERDAVRLLRDEEFDVVVNLSMTIAVPSDVWWIQGTPLDMTIRGMGESNLAARLADLAGHGTLASLDGTLTGKIRGLSRRIIANSPYLRDLYRARGFPVDGVVFTFKDFAEFRPRVSSAARDYVLLYIGKETPRIDLKPLHEEGVRVVGFGSKIPAATRMRQFTDWIDFRGRVTHDELVDLYSNALFTMFPFSFEPFGFVPIESMACGTPVLTYNRQGPASTVVDGRTGWLVGSPGELVTKAAELWRRGETGIRVQECLLRASDFSPQRSLADLLRWIEPGAGSRVLVPAA